MFQCFIRNSEFPSALPFSKRELHEKFPQHTTFYVFFPFTDALHVWVLLLLLKSTLSLFLPLASSPPSTEKNTLLQWNFSLNAKLTQNFQSSVDFWLVKSYVVYRSCVFLWNQKFIESNLKREKEKEAKREKFLKAKEKGWSKERNFKFPMFIFSMCVWHNSVEFVVRR